MRSPKKAERSIGKKGAYITEEMLAIHEGSRCAAGARSSRLLRTIIDYLSADREEHMSIAQANTELDENDRIVPDK